MNCATHLRFGKIYSCVWQCHVLIESPMLITPDILSELLAEFRPLFDRRQFRQFSRYIVSSWVSPTRSVAHLNGIFLEHTNQSNLNRFLRNIPVLEIFGKSVSMINSYSSDSVLVTETQFLKEMAGILRGRHGYSITQRENQYGECSMSLLPYLEGREYFP